MRGDLRAHKPLPDHLPGTRPELDKTFPVIISQQFRIHKRQAILCGIRTGDSNVKVRTGEKSQILRCERHGGRSHDSSFVRGILHDQKNFDVRRLYPPARTVSICGCMSFVTDYEAFVPWLTLNRSCRFTTDPHSGFFEIGTRNLNWRPGCAKLR